MRAELFVVAALMLVPGGFAQGGVKPSKVSQPDQTNWALGPFTRPVDGPVIEPRPASVFQDPILKQIRPMLFYPQRIHRMVSVSV